MGAGQGMALLYNSNFHLLNLESLQTTNHKDNDSPNSDNESENDSDNDSDNNSDNNSNEEQSDSSFGSLDGSPIDITNSRTRSETLSIERK